MNGQLTIPPLLGQAGQGSLVALSGILGMGFGTFLGSAQGMLRGSQAGLRVVTSISSPLDSLANNASKYALLVLQRLFDGNHRARLYQTVHGSLPLTVFVMGASPIVITVSGSFAVTAKAGSLAIRILAGTTGAAVGGIVGGLHGAAIGGVEGLLERDIATIENSINSTVQKLIRN